MACKQSPQPVPAGLKGPGRSLWTSTVGAFELDEHELALPREVRNWIASAAKVCS
jgi:hypothetical protein